MKVLLTGGAGFIGHHVIEHILKHTDWHIVSLDKLDTSGNLNRIADLEILQQEKRRVSIVHHDLRAAINSQVSHQIGKIDIVLHLAAASHVDRSIADPMSFVLDNVVGTVNILEYSKLIGVEKFLYFSTDEVFGPAPGGVHYSEWDRYNSGNPYAASKASAEEFALAFHNTYKMPIVITHTMNVFGERQHPEKFFPMTVKKALSGQKVIIHADSTCTVPGSRYYIHARNVADAILFVLAKGKIGDKYNIVGEREVDNLEFAKLIAGTVGKPLNYELVDFHSSRPGHDLRYALDGKKLDKMGWSLPKCFESSLAKTVEWTMFHPQWL